jgi:hypothetical protein
VTVTVGNILVLVIAGYSINPGTNPSGPTPEGFLLIFVVSLVNLVDVVRTAGHKDRKSHIGTLINLWFDAKERELRKRAGE